MQIASRSHEQISTFEGQSPSIIRARVWSEIVSDDIMHSPYFFSCYI